MGIWAMLFIGGIVSLILMMWGYSSDVAWAGFAHMPLYVGIMLFVGTILGVFWRIFSSR